MSIAITNNTDAKAFDETLLEPFSQLFPNIKELYFIHCVSSRVQAAAKRLWPHCLSVIFALIFIMFEKCLNLS